MDMKEIIARATAFDAEHEVMSRIDEARSIAALLQLREEFPAAYLVELESQGIPTDQHFLDELAASLLMHATALKASISQTFEELKSGTDEDRAVATVLEGRISMNRLAESLGAQVVDLSR